MGLLSKIFKPFKKIIRKVGGAIKSVAKLIAKPFKAVLKPIGKFFSKLGPIGTIALSFILPGIGGVLGSWLQGAGTAFQGLFTGMPRIFNAIGKIGNAIKSAATWGGDMYGKTIGKVFSEISGAIKGGINHLTNGRSADWGNWLSDFTDRISYKGEGFQKMNADGTLSAFDDVIDAATKATESLRKTLPTGTYYDPVNKVYMNEATGKAVTGEWWKERAASAAASQGVGPTADDTGFFERISDKWTDLKQSPAGKTYSMYNDIDNIFADDPRLRMPGTMGASAFSMLGNMGGDFGSEYSFSQFNTAPINNAPTFIDTLTEYITGAFGATMTPRHDILGFSKGYGGYGYGPENALGGGGD